MKTLLTLLAACVLPLLAPADAGAKGKVVTTTTDIADIARQVGGDRVEVHSVMRGAGERPQRDSPADRDAEAEQG